jgi:quinol-cytochrome oxidoreductase complex cytochrome b subunit
VSGDEGASRESVISRLIRWNETRTGLNILLHHALDEPIPGGAKLAYVFGSGLLFLFISQVVTGVFLAMYYVPSADHAHTTVAYITKEVSAGSFLRSIHAYGSSAIVIVLMLHLIQTFVYGIRRRISRRRLERIFSARYLLSGMD